MPRGPAPHVAVFTLYGPTVDNFLAALMPLRAVDQKGVADEVTRRVLTALFQPEAKPQFNASISVWRDVIVSRVRKFFEERMSDEEIERELAKRPQEYFNFEIDGVVFLAVSSPRERLIEVKLFTAPVGDDGKILRKHLRNGQLAENFEVRDYLGLMGFLSAAGDRGRAATGVVVRARAAREGDVGRAPRLR
ncbi:MAG: hypothetical protein Kow0069_02500 [Promethearchaeota archaeon]